MSAIGVGIKTPGGRHLRGFCFLSLNLSCLVAAGVAFRYCAKHSENIVDVRGLFLSLILLEMRRKLGGISGLASADAPHC